MDAFGGMMDEQSEIDRRDLQLLAGIIRGPGNYPTPSPERMARLLQQGLVKKKHRTLAPTLKGRVIVWLARFQG
jgi:hypothetical protein